MDISVIIPAYNAGKTLGRCLESIQKQTLPPCEILVVDDGSSDGTGDVARTMASVKVNNRKKGAGGARNTGGFAARGEILAFTDSDCIVPPDWLENIAKALEDDAVGAVAGGYTHHEGRSLIGRFACIELLERRKAFSDFVNTGVSNNLAVRRALFQKVGGFPEIFNEATAEDMIFTFHVSRIAKIRWLRHNGVGHHFHERIWPYLAQQYRFARDAAVTYYRIPAMATVKTHHGYMLYLEALLACLTLVALVHPVPWFVIGILSMLAINLPLLGRIARSGDWKLFFFALAFLPVRDFNLVICLAGGALAVLRRSMESRREASC